MSGMLKVKGREIYKRIYSRHIAEVQSMLGDITFIEAVNDITDDPYKKTIPFLWGILQGKDGDKTKEDAQDLYDDLVDAGYTPAKFMSLVIDICDQSGFFTPAQKRGAILFQEMMETNLNKMAEKMEENLKSLAESESESKSSSKPVAASD